MSPKKQPARYKDAAPVRACSPAAAVFWSLQELFQQAEEVTGGFPVGFLRSLQHELSQACEKRGATPFACFSRGHLTPYWQVSADAKDSPCVAIIILSCPLFNIVQLTTAQEVFKSVRGKVMKFLKVLLPLSERRGCYITFSHFYSELQGDTVCYSTV